MPDRVAAIDIGTNTVLMLVAERDALGDVVAVAEHAEITRLGAGVDRTQRLDGNAIDRTLAALERFNESARSLGVRRFGVVATSAARDAQNGEAFTRRAEAIIGASIEIASGQREARLTFAGALGGLGIRAPGAVAVIDVGGGSTEIVVGTLVVGGAPVIDWSVSFDIGSVRLTERHVAEDPPTKEALSAISRAAREAFERESVPHHAGARVVAIAGTATTYAAIACGLARYEEAPPHGHVLSCQALRQLIESLAAKPLEERRATTGLDARRADVIVAGGLILNAAAEALGATELIVSDRGVRWGLADELLGSSATGTTAI